MSSGGRQDGAHSWRTGWAGSGGPLDVAMMQAADFGNRNGHAEFGRSVGGRRVHPGEREVSDPSGFAVQDEQEPEDNQRRRPQTSAPALRGRGHT